MIPANLRNDLFFHDFSPSAPGENSPRGARMIGLRGINPDLLKHKILIVKGEKKPFK